MPVHEKILLMDIEKPGIATWLFCIYFHFSAIIFHVDSCESYATLDTPRGEKSGLFSSSILFSSFDTSHQQGAKTDDSTEVHKYAKDNEANVFVLNILL